MTSPSPCAQIAPPPKKRKQTAPPTIPIHTLYPQSPPTGHLLRNTPKTTGPELTEWYETLRYGAEAHRQTRRYIQKIIKPGVKLIEVAETIEECTRKLMGGDGKLESGVAFPTGLSVNNCAAHWSPNSGDKTILQQDDVLKIDFGNHTKGHIIDSAFTMSANPKYNNLLKAVKEATNAAIKEAGIDVRLCDIGAVTNEVITSYEIELDGKTIPIVPCRNLNGHSISQYKIHSTKSVPLVDNGDTRKMEENECYAIETFATTGQGHVYDQGEVSHYMRDFEADGNIPLKPRAKALLNTIEENFGTLGFCKRYLDRIGETNYAMSLRELVQEGVVNSYPPLCDVAGSFTAQFEHTILLRPSCKEVLTRGDDY